MALSVECKKLAHVAVDLETESVGSNDLGEGLPGLTVSGLAPDVMIKSFSYLDAKSVGIASMAFRDFNMIATEGSVSGMYLRKESRFAVTAKGGQMLFLEEYLRGQKQQIWGIKNLNLLLKERPKEFLKFILHAIPHSPELIVSDLNRIYLEDLAIADLIDSLPRGQSAQEKLAGVMIEVLVWDQIWVQVWEQVRSQVGGQIWNQLGDQVWDQVGDQVWNQVGNQVRAQVRDQVRAQVGNQIKAQARGRFRAQIKALVKNQVKTQLRDLVDHNLQQFDFALAYDDGTLTSMLKPAIDYTFAVYQLGTLSLKHTTQFKNIHSGLSEFISHRISEEQALEVLNHIDIPIAPEGNFLIHTQLELIRKVITTDD